MKSATTVTGIIFLIGLLEVGRTQQKLPTADEALQKVSAISGISDLSGLNASAIPAIEQATNLLKQKCEKNGGPNAFDNAKRAQEDMQQCLQSLINMTQLQHEMELAKPEGNLDEVFIKYCRRSPILKSCIKNFTNAVEPCLEVEERESKRIILNITESLLSFICYKEGDRIALFISAGGPECFQSKQQGIQDCINATYGHYFPTVNRSSNGIPTIDSLPSLILGNKECSDISTLQVCVVKKLEECSDPTPANIVESVFNFIKRVTPCENLLNKPNAAAVGVQRVSSATTTTMSLLTTLSLLFMTIRIV